MQSIGGYRVLGRLGSGGMGAVFRCLDEATGRELAVKVLPQGVWATSYQRERFRREALALAKLRHPNVLRVFSAGEEDGLPFLAVALHSGGSLSERVREDPLAAEEAARIGLALARGLAAAHAAGILHRDLKPDNVLFDERGEPLLCDFGLAKDLSGEGERQSLTQTGAFLGTPGYWAPEQAGGADDTGPATDVFGLGATLYAALTGGPPFRGDSVIEVLNATHLGAIEPLTRLRPDLPPRLTRVVMDCLAQDPDQRPRLPEVERRLESVLAAGGSGRRGKVWLLGGGLVLSLSLGLAGAAGRGSGSAPSPAPAQNPAASVSPTATPVGSTAPDFLRDQERPLLSVPGVRRVHFAAGRRYLLTRAHETEREVVLQRWDLSSGELCADGDLRALAPSSGDEHVYVPPRGARFVDWYGARLNVRSVTAQGVRTRAVKWQGRTLKAVACGPSGAPVLVSAGQEVGQLEEGELRPLFLCEELREIKHLALSPGGDVLALGGGLAPPKIGYRLSLRGCPSGEPLAGFPPQDFQRWPRLLRFLPGAEPRLLVHDGLSVTLLGRRGLEVLGEADSLGLAQPLHPSGVSTFVVLSDEHILSLARPIPGFQSYDLALWNVTTRRLVLRFLERKKPHYIDLCVDAEREWVALLTHEGEVEFRRRSRFLPK